MARRARSAVRDRDQPTRPGARRTPRSLARSPPGPPAPLRATPPGRERDRERTPAAVRPPATNNRAAAALRPRRRVISTSLQLSVGRSAVWAGSCEAVPKAASLAVLIRDVSTEPARDDGLFRLRSRSPGEGLGPRAVGRGRYRGEPSARRNALERVRVRRAGAWSNLRGPHLLDRERKGRASFNRSFARRSLVLSKGDPARGRLPSRSRAFGLLTYRSGFL